MEVIFIISYNNKPIKRIWSKHLEITGLKKSDFVVDFQPVYDYNWEITNNSMINYKVSPVYIDLYHNQDSIQTYQLPEIYKGKCTTIHLKEIVTPKHD